MLVSHLTIYLHYRADALSTNQLQHTGLTDVLMTDKEMNDALHAADFT